MSTPGPSRPVAAPGTRCLLLQLEPTPYILPRALYVYKDPELHTDLIWTFVNSSQDWGRDAEIGNLPVLLDRNVSQWRRLGRVASLMINILRGRYTVAHLAGWGHWVVRLAMFCCKVRGVPFSVESDTQLNRDRTGWKEWLKRRIYPILLNWPSVVIPGGTRQANLFRYYGVSEEKINVSHMTTDILKIQNLSTRSRDEFRAELNLKDEDVVVLYVGRLEEYKGIGVLLKAFEKALQEEPKLVLVLVGDGSMIQKVRGMHGRLPANRVHVPGRQPSLAVVQWMRSSDMLVLPSLREQWGLVINEAMTCGLPVIVSDACGCIDDLVHEGENGFIFPSGDAETLAERMVRLARDQVRRASMGQEGQKLIAPWMIERQAETIRAALARMSHQ